MRERSPYIGGYNAIQIYRKEMIGIQDPIALDAWAAVMYTMCTIFNYMEAVYCKTNKRIKYPHRIEEGREKRIWKMEF